MRRPKLVGAGVLRSRCLTMAKMKAARRASKGSPEAEERSARLALCLGSCWSCTHTATGSSSGGMQRAANIRGIAVRETAA